MARPVRVKEGMAGERAVEGLKRLVVTGELAPGEQIRQEETAVRLGVSRMLLREALRALANQGLLDHRPHQGFFVVKRAPVELAQIMLMLDLLEPQLMRTMERPHEQVVQELQGLNRRMEQLVDDWDQTETLALNRQFHFVLFGLSPYRLVLQEVERLWGFTDPFIAQKLSTPDKRRLAVYEHDAILRSLAEGDLPGAASAHDAHRESGRRGVLPDVGTSAVRLAPMS